MTSLISPARSVLCFTEPVQSFQTKWKNECQLRLVKGMLLWQWCLYVEPLAGRGPYAETSGYQTMWPRHRMAASLFVYLGSSIILNLRWSTTKIVEWSVPKICRSLLRAGLETHMLWRLFPLSRNHERLRLQWARELRHWQSEWQNVVVLDESLILS